MLNIKVVSLSLAITAAVSFVVCVGWGLVMPESLHMHGFLELFLPGFQWLSVGAFVLGLIESFLFGIYGGLVFVPIYNTLHRRLGIASAEK
ncbi:MAG: hypothetical protein HKN35_07040 [Woeseia sp.]|nr:hypothetical protein [Woeseia sp.]NNL55449.1 hypothetical protein [Woeseia sp.]